MTASQQIQPTGGPSEDETHEVVTGQTQVSSVDDILDEIDTVLETNAAAFVQGFVQKGGQ